MQTPEALKSNKNFKHIGPNIFNQKKKEKLILVKFE